MKKLLYLLLFVSLGAFGQNTNGTLQRQIAPPNALTGVFGAVRDSIYTRAETRTLISSSLPSLSVGTVSSGGYANGLNYASGVFRLGKVSATNPGVLTTGTDTIAGNKRFTFNTRFAAGLFSDGDIQAVSNVKSGELMEITNASSDARILITTQTSSGNAYTQLGRASSGSGNAYNLYRSASIPKWSEGIFSGDNTYKIRNHTVSGSLGSSTNAIVIDTLNNITISSLTTGSVYSSSGTLTNTAPTSGTIGYWSRTGTTLSPNTANDNINIGTGSIISGDIFISKATPGLQFIPTASTQYNYIEMGDQSTYGWQFGRADNSGSIAPSGAFYMYNRNTGTTAYSITTGNVFNIPSLTTTTQSPNDNSTKVATTAYVDNATGGGLTFASGTYTPTLTNGANVSSSAATTNHYIRVGNQVSISGKVNVTPTAAAGTNTVISLSLPVASNFANQADVSGIVNVYNNVSATAIGIVNANSGTDLIEINFGSLATTGHTVSYSLQYTVL